MLDLLPLRPGVSGEPVRDLQRRLSGAGHPCGDDEVGRYGPATEEAVRGFQARSGLRVDGVCGDQTWSSLVEAGHRLGDRLLSLRQPMMRGDDVAQLQQLLGALGFDAGRVDGILGPDTAGAIAEFQRNAGLITDGVCGPETVAGLRLFGSRLEPNGTQATLASVREFESLRSAPPRLEGRRIGLGETGDAAALAAAVGRTLAAAGALVEIVQQPDGDEQATAANAFEADVFVALAIQAEVGAACAFYERDDYASVGGRRLANLVLEHLAARSLGPCAPAQGMRLPVLRATRMPAVVIEVGDPRLVVAKLPAVAAAIAEAIAAWAIQPV